MPPSNNDSDPAIGDIAGIDDDLDAIARMERKIQTTLARVWGEESAPRGKEDQQAA